MAMRPSSGEIRPATQSRRVDYRARRAEENSYAGRNGKVHIKMECATHEASGTRRIGWI